MEVKRLRYRLFLKHLIGILGRNKGRNNAHEILEGVFPKLMKNMALQIKRFWQTLGYTQKKQSYILIN